MYVDENGMKRSEAKPEYRKIPYCAIRRLAVALTEGSLKYDEGLYHRNWFQASPEGAAQAYNHVIEHLFAWVCGDGSEDHLGHAMAGIAFLIQFEEDGRFDPVANMPKTYTEVLEAKKWEEADKAFAAETAALNEQGQTSPLADRIRTLLGLGKVA